jgi:hypothetical protein
MLGAKAPGRYGIVNGTYDFSSAQNRERVSTPQGSRATPPQLLRRGASGGVVSSHATRVYTPSEGYPPGEALGRSKETCLRRGGTKMPFVCPIRLRLLGAYFPRVI